MEFQNSSLEACYSLAGDCRLLVEGQLAAAVR